MTFKKILFPFLGFFLALVLLETIAIIMEKAMTPAEASTDDQPGWQAEFFRHRMDFHESDTRLLWRHRPNLHNPLILTNSEGRLGREIAKPKSASEFRILLLGDSSPVGLGLTRRNEAFGEQLRHLLNQYFGGNRKVELVNAAVSGYTSEQLRRFFELHGWSHEPDMVIVHCGSNDASISGTLTDRQLLEKQTAVGLRELLGKLAVYRMLKAALSSGSRGSSGDPGTLTVRVTPEQYYQNLRAIADICGDHDCPVIFLKPPVARLWPAGLQFKIFRHITGEDGRPIFPEALAEILGREIKYCLNPEQMHLYGKEIDPFKKAVYESAFDYGKSGVDDIKSLRDALNDDPDNPLVLNNLGVSFWENAQFDSADVYLRRARDSYIRKGGDSPGYAAIAAGSPFLFNLGVNYLSQGDIDMADIMLDSALQADYFSLRIKRDYWKAIDSLNGPDNVVIIDLPAIFAKSGGDSLFVDHCHPTREGHRLIAQALFDAIRENFLMK